MDLAELLAREGYLPTDIPALLAWARARARASIAALEDASPLRGLLTGRPLGHVPGAIKPQAGAGGRAGLSVELEDIAEAAEAVEEDAPIDLRSAVAAATAPHPAAPEEDPESGFGGFARFGGIVRLNRPYPRREETAEDRPTLASSFARAVEREAEETRPEPPAPTPPRPSAELSSALPVADLAMSAEESGGLVLGIPDEELADVPIPRTVSASAPHRRFTVVEPDPPASPGLSDSSVALASLAEELNAADSGEFLAPTPAPRPIVREEPVGVDLRQPIPVSRREPTGPRDAAAPTETPTDPQAPVLRHRTAKKKVVELGAPLARPHGGSGSAKVVPRSEPSRASRKTPPPPPPQGLRRTPPPLADDDIQELSRVEMIDDLPAYLRDDED